MVDEIRLIECPNGECVLIGMGSMGWSGGMYNGSRKCYVQRCTHDILIPSAHRCFSRKPFACIDRPIHQNHENHFQHFLLSRCVDD